MQVPPCRNFLPIATPIPSTQACRKLLMKVSSFGLNDQACYEFFLDSPTFKRDFVKFRSTAHWPCLSLGRVPPPLGGGHC
ncbi:hypothetical protein TrLO_g15070 [Triparma laevis f. longispina]|uniref:Uncharacterized protein n=1 Tax=Triparma laevis f. longispina TaxID=1714387 RepID=A0A9W7A963_9STRA|nr:hypothetical protein TrLO_g15070 [Triparma laevis f. longispina]